MKVSFEYATQLQYENKALRERIRLLESGAAMLRLRKGCLGDVKIKRYLNKVLEAELAPIRERREKFAQDEDAVYEMLLEGSKKANKVANATLEQVRDAIGLNYFKNR